MKKISFIIGVIITLVFIAGIITTIYTVANMDNGIPTGKSCEICTTGSCPCMIDEIDVSN
jgi:hypothetical protein